MAKEQHPDLKSNIDESDPLSQSWIPRDWGEASEAFDHIKAYVSQNNLFNINEAETRLTIIDRMLHEVLGWRYGQIKPEERLEADGTGYIDYVIRNGDYTIVVEAKRYGKSFPSPTKRKKLRLFGSALGTREIAEAINQAIGYARDKKADVAIVRILKSYSTLSRL
jgi:hypothetical protein